MRDYLAGKAGSVGDVSGGFLASAPLSGRLLLTLVTCGGFLLVLLWLPIIGDHLNGFLSAQGWRAAPRLLLLGVGLGVIGLIAGIRVLEIAGASIVGLLIVGLIFDNY